MKVAILFCFVILLVSCNQNAPKEMKGSSSQPVVENLSVTNKTEGVSDFSTSNENEIRERKVGIKGASTDFGLPDLELFELPKEDVEIRLWRFSGLGMPKFQDLAVKKSVFILRRTSRNWAATIIRDTIDYSTKQKTEKRIETKLAEPKSGWENAWRQLVEDEILTLPNGKEVGDLGGLDTQGFTVETKSDGVYRLYKYNGSFHSYSKEEGIKPIREAYQMAKIVNVIGDEFDMSDFRVKVPAPDAFKTSQLP